MDEQGSHTNMSYPMLTLERRRERSIYSLSANGGEVKGYMGLSPQLDTARYRTSDPWLRPVTG